MAIEARGSVPVTVVTGFLGAGKTSLVNHVLTTAPDRRIGVIVNDFGDVEIDRRLILETTDEVISLKNGCICCSMRDGVRAAVFRVLEQPVRPEHILIEASGVSDPGALAELFMGLEQGRLLRLDGIVALVDAEQFPFDDLAKQPAARNQVLASDLIVLNKCDLVDDSRLQAIEASIRKRLPQAVILRAVRAEAPIEVVLGAHRTGAAPPGWRFRPSPSLEAHGLHAHSFRSDRSFRAADLFAALEALPAGILRVKGIVSVEAKAGERLVIHRVGRRLHLDVLSVTADEPMGGAIVFIGTREAIDGEALDRVLEACLVPS